MCFMLLILYLFFFSLSLSPPPAQKNFQTDDIFYSIMFFIQVSSSIEFSSSQKIFILLYYLLEERAHIIMNLTRGNRLSSYFFLCPSVFVAKSISIQIVVVSNLMTRFKEKYNNGIKQGNGKTTSYFVFLFFFLPTGSISSQITITLSP